MTDGVIQRREQAGIFGIIVGLATQIFAQLSDGPANLILNHDAVSGGAGIAAGSAIDVRHQVTLIEAGNRASDKFLRVVPGPPWKWTYRHDVIYPLIILMLRRAREERSYTGTKSAQVLDKRYLPR